MRHHQIEKNQIGMKRAEFFEHGPRISDRLNPAVAVLEKQLFQESNIRGLIINDENLHAAKFGIEIHAPMPSVAVKAASRKCPSITFTKRSTSRGLVK